VDGGGTVNQRERNGEWVLLGTWRFARGEAGYVKISAANAGYTIADAVRFELAGADPSEGLTAPPRYRDLIGAAYETAAEFLGATDFFRVGGEDFDGGAAFTKSDLYAVFGKLFGWHGVDRQTLREAGFSAILDLSDGETLTGGQLTALLAVAAGYTPHAVAAGGYPDGYQAAAIQAGILKNAAPRFSAQVSRGEAAILLYNALHAKLMKQTVFGERSEFSVSTGVTLLSEYARIYKITGRITETGYTGLYSEKPAVSGNRVVINGDSYFAGLSGAFGLLGRTAEVYYREDAEERVILFARPRAASKTRTLLSGEIAEASFTNGGIALSCYDGGRVAAAIDVSASVSLIYNGRYLRNFTPEHLKPKNGGLFLIDDDGDGVYETVCSMNFTTIVAGEVYASGVVRDQFIEGRQLLAEVADSGVNYLAVKNGKSIRLADLREHDVLSVAESADQKLFYILVSDKTLFGMMNLSDTDFDGRREIVIDEIRFGVTPDRDLDVALSYEGTFYLDVFGRVAAVSKGFAARVGYVRDVGYKRGVSGGAEFKLLTQDGAWLRVDGARKIRFNGGDGVPPTQVADRFRAWFAAETDAAGNRRLSPNRVVLYTLNGDDELAAVWSAGEANERLTQSGGERTALFWKAATQSLQSEVKTVAAAENKIYTDGATVVIKAPETNIDEDKEYTAESTAYFQESTSVSYTAVTFNEDAYKTAQIILVYKDEYAGVTVNDSSELFLVTGAAAGLNADGEQIRVLKGWFGGKETRVPLAITVTEALFPNPSPGDIVRFNRNKEGEISGVAHSGDNGTLLYSDREDPARHKIFFSSRSNYLNTVFGTARGVKGGKLRVETLDDNQDALTETVWDVSVPGVKFYVYEKDHARAGTAGDIAVGDLVFAQISNFRCLAVVIYK
ncbi:MAG: hypothetical protein LBH54_03525, partial [Clostridiales bacterium]|nr:hypothetical protein [Clostridiales bacterium]